MPWPLSEAAPALVFCLSPAVPHPEIFKRSLHHPPVEEPRPRLPRCSLGENGAVFLFPSFPLSNFYFLFSKAGRSFPAVSPSSAANRPLNSRALNRPSRHSQRRKSSARPSPFFKLHSAHADTRLR